MCGKSFGLNNNLAKTITFQNRDISRVDESCGKPFAHKNNLVKPILIHNYDSPHTSGTCRNSFKLDNERTRHMRMFGDDEQ